MAPRYVPERCHREISLRYVLETTSRGVRTIERFARSNIQMQKITERAGKTNRKRCDKQLKELQEIAERC
jgi:hypothetical protein